MRESKIQAYFRSRLEAARIYVRKLQWTNRRGAPDFFVQLYGNQSVFIEFKKPEDETRKGKLSVQQDSEIEELRKRGARVIVVDSLERAEIVANSLIIEDIAGWW